MNAGIPGVERKMCAPRVVIVGAGPSGLRAARELAPAVSGDVLVLEREQEAGGFPRHCAHTGFGMRDERRVLNGPEYARRMVRAARQAGAGVRTSAMVTGWSADGALEVVTSQGLRSVKADVVVLATGSYERPRAGRLIPGDRPAGVYTTGLLQAVLHRETGSRAIVVGSGPACWPALRMLRHAGFRTSVVTDRHVPDVVRGVLAIPMWTRSRVTGIAGTERVRAVEITDESGRCRSIGCDTVVFTGEAVPDSELFRAAGVEIDSGTRGPVVDAGLRTDRPGVFAAGTVAHPAGAADRAALDGVRVAQSVLEYLDGERPPGKSVRLVPDEPVRWISPMVHRAGDGAPKALLARADGLAAFPRVSVRQNGCVVAEKRLLWTPAFGSLVRIPADVLDAVRPGEARISMRR